MLNKIKSSLEVIEKINPQIEKLSKTISNKIQSDGRIIFVGAGISSEIINIIIDELWFNFQINKNKFLSLKAVRNYSKDMISLKEIEEIYSTSVFELDDSELNKDDLVIGLSSSGKTQYVLTAIKYAYDLGCETVIITDFSNLEIEKYLNYKINAGF